MAESDQEQAAQLYKLASMYASEDYSRQDKLAAEAQRLLELVGDESGQVADILLGRAKSAEQAGQIGRAFLHYVQCIRAIAKILDDAAESYLSGEGVPLRLGDETKALSEKLLYCARQMREIEGSDA